MNHKKNTKKHTKHDHTGCGVWSQPRGHSAAPAQCRTACMPPAPRNATTSRRLNPATHPFCNYRSFHFQQTRGTDCSRPHHEMADGVCFQSQLFHNFFKVRSLKVESLSRRLSEQLLKCLAEPSPHRLQWSSAVNDFQVGGRQKFTCLLQSIADVEWGRGTYSFCGIPMRRLSASLWDGCYIIIVRRLMIIELYSN